LLGVNALIFVLLRTLRRRDDAEEDDPDGEREDVG
jgi:hypothetical protein